jgi:flagellar basal-body rod protein FlgC
MSPNRRLEAIFKADGDEISGVNIDEIKTDKSNFQSIFEPSHPDADENGYVLMPNVDLPTELINLDIATRAYQANAAILKRYQQMVETTLELLR